MKSYNLASAIYEMADSQPDTLAMAFPSAPGKALPKDGPIPYREYSFHELALETNKIARGLQASGFEPGDRVVLMIPPGIEFFTFSFALMQCGIVPVLIDPGIGFKNLKTCIAESDPVGFIGIPKAQLARIILGWGKGSIRKLVTIGSNFFWRGTSLKQLQTKGTSSAAPVCRDVAENELAAILFTSGSTGVPKGVMYTHGNFRQQVEIISQSFGMKPGEIDLPTFAPFALFNPTVGISTVVPDMNPTKPAEVDPERIIRALDQYQITNMFGSPALIDRVGRYIEANKVKMPSLKRVLSAGAPVPAKAMMRFAGMLNPDAQIFTPYGATESMPVAKIGSHQLLTDEIQHKTENGAGICLGKPVDMLEVKVIRISDEPISNWSDDLEIGTSEIGEIVVKGKNVTHAYFNREAATKLAKISDGNGFWHRMGDLGYKDAEGNLWFCGRKAHRVILAHRELYSIPCESIFNKHPQVYRSALVGAKGQAVLCVEIDKESPQTDKNQLKKELLSWAAQNEMTRDIQTLLFHPSFPVDIRHNAKIRRETLALWAAKQLK